MKSLKPIDVPKNWRDELDEIAEFDRNDKSKTVFSIKEAHNAKITLPSGVAIARTLLNNKEVLDNFVQLRIWISNWDQDKSAIYHLPRDDPDFPHSIANDYLNFRSWIKYKFHIPHVFFLKIAGLFNQTVELYENFGEAIDDRLLTNHLSKLPYICTLQEARKCNQDNLL